MAILSPTISHVDEYMCLSVDLASSFEELDIAALPTSYIIDYVKVYKKKK